MPADVRQAMDIAASNNGHSMVGSDFFEVLKQWCLIEENEAREAARAIESVPPEDEVTREVWEAAQAGRKTAVISPPKKREKKTEGEGDEEER